SGLSYISMSGGDLAKFIMRVEHVTVINEIFKTAENSSVPTVIFIDEVDALAKKRDASTNQTMLELQNAFLSHTGSENKNIMIIAATNNKDLLEKTFESRMTYKIKIVLPGMKERITMLKNYMSRFFKSLDI